MSDELTLRYFDARGRAQFLRYYLKVRNIDFIDERVPVEPDFASWMRMRDDETLTGPFHKLPVLEVGELLIAETPVITDFLHRQFGDAQVLAAQTELQHIQLISSLYNDVTLPIGTLLWADRIYVGLDFEVCSKGMFGRVQQHMRSIEQALIDWRWHEDMNRRPIMLADCILWECIDLCRTVFGPHFKVETVPTLAAIHDRYATGTAFSELLEESPCPITARDGEHEVIERIQELLAD